LSFFAWTSKSKIPLQMCTQSKILFLVLMQLTAMPGFSQFTPGNIVALQVGNGTTPLVNSGNQILLKEYTPSGAAMFSVAVSTSVNPLIIGGTAVSEGGLCLAANGKYLVFAGYASNLSNTTSLSGTSASFLNRGIGIVDAVGNYSRVATSSIFYSGNSIRSAAADGNNNYWAAGANAGANYFGNNAAAVTIQNSVTNARNVIPFNGNLYLSTGSGTAGIYQVSNGFPITSGQTCSLVIATSGSASNTASPYAFYFNPGQTICYVADDRTPINGGGIQKWMYALNTWSLAYTLGTGTSFGARGLVVDFSEVNPKIFATSSAGTTNRLIVITDLGPGSTATTIATASPNTIFRGLAFSPFCSAPQIDSITIPGTLCAAQAFTLGALVQGSAPLLYSWVGSGSFVSSAQSPTNIATISGVYSLTVNNGCGSDSKSIQITVNPLPNVTANSFTVCSGGTATLIASGAASYSWTNGQSGNSVAVSPNTTTTYSVTGTTPPGCLAMAVSSVLVISSLSVAANSTVCCSGDTLVLSAYGAMNYTWSTASYSSTTSVSPLSTTVYTIEGSAPGCSSTAVATCTVIVNQLPIVAFLPFKNVMCVNDAAITLDATPAGGTFIGTGIVGNLFNPFLLQATNYLLKYRYTDTNTCTGFDTATVFVSLCTAQQENDQTLKPKISMNKVLNELRLDLNDFAEQVVIKIFNGTGQKLVETIVREKTFIHDLDNFATGLYFLCLSSSKYEKIIRFVKD
jgi:hypothetical protein